MKLRYTVPDTFPLSSMCLQKLLRTSDSWSLLLVRVSVGIVMCGHGLQKLGYLGGGGWDGTIQFMTGMGIPAFIAALVIIGESVGGAALVLGLLTRFCAASIAVIMLGAITLVHAKNGLFGQGGFELQLLILSSCLALVLAGGGKWSIDRVIVK